MNRAEQTIHPSLNPIPCTAKLRVLNDDTAWVIHPAYLDVLEHTYTTSPIEETRKLLVKEAGPNAEYKTHAHTYTHFRDFWYPKLFYCDRFITCRDRIGTNPIERLNDHASKILDQHQPQPLSREVDLEVERQERSWQN